MLNSGLRFPELRCFGRSPSRGPAARLLFNFVTSSSRFSTNASDVIGPTPGIEAGDGVEALFDHFVLRL